MNTKARFARRRFLMLSAGTVGATVLTCSGLVVLGTRQPAVEFVEANCGDKVRMSDRILVTYASRYGSTGEVAEAIGKVLCGGSRSFVDVCLVKNVTEVSHYQAVVVGSAIQGGEWLPEALEFIEVHRETLSRVPVAYFLCCKRLRDDTPETHREAIGYMDGVQAHVPEIKPVQVGLFAGKIDPSTMPPFVRLLIALSGSPTGDWRDWDAIRAWASSLRPVLQASD